MNSNEIRPSQAVNKVYLKQPVEENSIVRFRDAMQKMLKNVNQNESEEHNKNLVMDFLSTAFYKDTNAINTKGKTDAAIYASPNSINSNCLVLIEAKGPGRPDMATRTELNCKALHELILYYIRAEEHEHNTDIKHLIITNCYEWFVFDKTCFYRLFLANKSFAKQVVDADRENNTDYAYEQVIRKKVEEVKHRLKYTYFNLAEYKNKLEDNSVIATRKFIAIYKLLSPTHLLKLPFQNDHNALNRGFYNELLYIMGVEEVTDDKVKIIKRLKAKRQPYSLVEQAISHLDGYGLYEEKALFDASLGLVLNWTNRLLFLKLLESQLIAFNKGTISKFLTTNLIPDYDVLNDLFMKVLAVPTDCRNEELGETFKDVPYLNSSLFEMSDLERKYFPISGIRLGTMEVMSQTAVKDGKGRRIKGSLPTLEYLFRFLDAFDFGIEKQDDANPLRQESKTIINASVLGKIFEKINGYKDGSFFTPGYITQYICRKTLRRAVVNRFNEVKGWECEDFLDLCDQVGIDRESRIEANQIVNSLRICDPAVGSGHFLVSALNELIAIKREMGILQDHREKPRPITEYITVENDELVVTDEDGDMFVYNQKDPFSQRVQETLFEEKRTIIENCLFGVDLNPKSVEICQLRLWIELLKNAYYYKKDEHSDNRVLQTLPNIDINIKQGNSLLSVYPVCVGRKLTIGAKDIKESVKNYKHYVREYKNCRQKDIKLRLNNAIAAIKFKLAPPKQTELYEDNTQAIAEQGQYRSALEWMIEFPEVLDDNGVFDGFDVIIGNPPYISLEKLKKDVKAYAKMHRMDEEGHKDVPTYKTLESRGDIYSLFVERGLQVLKENGLLTYILPNKWMKVGYGKPLRQLFLDKNLTQAIDFGDNQIFDDATTYTCIIRMTKAKSAGQIQSSSIRNVNSQTLAEDIEERKETFETHELTNGIWIISSREDFERAEAYKKSMGTLGDFVGKESYRGLLTGLSKAFNVSIETANKLITEDVSASEILRPFMQGKGMKPFGKPQPESYLLFIPKGFTMRAFGLNPEDKEDRKNMPKEDEAWEWFERTYPSIAQWLLHFKDDASKRSDKGDYWWELRACAYYGKFSEPKLFYQTFQVRPCFIYSDQSVFCNNSMWFLSAKDKALLALLCSNMGWWLISKYCPRIQNGYQLIWDNFKQISVPSVLPPRLGELADLLMLDVESGKREDYAAHLLEVNREVDKLYYEAIKGMVFDGVAY
ncbi:MAG: Eco57I restriction-modification methylase domain-containing protein [Prevotella sp.]|nr:Eco57I restriction-modification methylase domain-containing protein [Prevotella sp.]